jgi:hypothetical protein
VQIVIGEREVQITDVDGRLGRNKAAAATAGFRLGEAAVGRSRRWEASMVVAGGIVVVIVVTAAEALRLGRGRGHGSDAMGHKRREEERRETKRREEESGLEKCPFGFTQVLR